MGWTHPPTHPSWTPPPLKRTPRGRGGDGRGGALPLPLSTASFQEPVHRAQIGGAAWAPKGRRREGPGGAPSVPGPPPPPLCHCPALSARSPSPPLCHCPAPHCPTCLCRRPFPSPRLAPVLWSGAHSRHDTADAAEAVMPGYPPPPDARCLI